MGATFVAYACALMGYAYIVFTDPAYNSGGEFTAVVLAYAFLIGLQVTNCFTTPLSAGIDTIFVAMAWDPEALMREHPELYEVSACVRIGNQKTRADSVFQKMIAVCKYWCGSGMKNDMLTPEQTRMSSRRFTHDRADHRCPPPTCLINQDSETLANRRFIQRRWLHCRRTGWKSCLIGIIPTSNTMECEDVIRHITPADGHAEQKRCDCC